MISATEIKADLNATTAQIDAARRMVAAGQIIDLSGLQERVEAICGAIQKLPDAERGGFRDPIVALLSELDGLTAILTEQHERLSVGLKALSAQSRAQKAYGTAAKTESDS